MLTLKSSPISKKVFLTFDTGNQIIGVNGDKPINFPRGMKNGINHMNRI